MAYLDTHEAVKILIREEMFNEKQAEAIVGIVNKRDGTLATKADIIKLKGELKEDISELKSNIKDFKNEMIKWFVGTQFATLAIVIAIIAYLR
jgi:hypothetical protein